MQLWNNRVLALMPHPDDIEILCAGTLLRLKEAGWEVFLGIMTQGDCGSDELASEEISQVRAQEARNAAAVIGAASCGFLGFSDLSITFDIPSRRKVTGFIREIDPALVITTPPRDYMFDHEITSALVRDACFNAACRNYTVIPESNKPASGVPYLYYSDSISGHDIFGQTQPVSALIDISTVIEAKSAALAAHESQRAWLKKQHDMDDYVASMLSWCSKRGAEAGVAYAEAFTQHLGHPHPQDDLLSRLLS